MIKIILLLISFLFFVSPVYAFSVGITATDIQPTQARITDGCEDGVRCDPNSLGSYILDVNTLEQRDVITFIDEGYNLGTIMWIDPLEDGHTYIIHMHSDLFDFDSISQDFLLLEPTPIDTPTSTPTPTNIPTPTPTDTPTPTPTITPTPTNTPTPTPVPVHRKLTMLLPARIWVGLENILSIGTKFDLKAEVYKDSSFVTSGQVNSFNPGISGLFITANLVSISFDSFTQTDYPVGTRLKLKLYVRNSCFGSLRNQGIARMWFNDKQANSRFGATIDSTNNYFLRDGFVLSTTIGSTKKKIDVQAGARCSAFKPFGTWEVTP